MSKTEKRCAVCGQRVARAAGGGWVHVRYGMAASVVRCRDCGKLWLAYAYVGYPPGDADVWLATTGPCSCGCAYGRVDHLPLVYDQPTLPGVSLLRELGERIRELEAAQEAAVLRSNG